MHGIASLAGAHDGSTLAHAIQNDLNLNDLIAALAALANAVGADGLYDFKLDQFGLDARRDGESAGAYVNRVMDTMFDSGSRDTAFYDLSLDGAAELNRRVTAQPDVYYYSWSNHTSRRGLLGNHVPMVETNLFLMPFTTFMGLYEDTSPTGIAVDSSYWENDGITNTRGMGGPTLGHEDPRADYEGTSRPGVWQQVAHLDRWDHWDLLGLLDLNRDYSDHLSVYTQAALLLRATSPR